MVNNSKEGTSLLSASDNDAEPRIEKSGSYHHLYVLVSCALGAALIMAISLFGNHRGITFSEMKYQISNSGSSTGDSSLIASDGLDGNSSDTSAYVKVCNINNYPTSNIENELLVSPGCLVLADKDLSSRRKVKKYEYATVTTICATSAAGEVYLDTSFLHAYGLIFDSQSLLSTVTLNDDSVVTVYSDDGASGLSKTILGKKHVKGSAFTHSLSGQKYPGTSNSVKDSAKSLVFTTTNEKLQDCKTPSSIYDSKHVKNFKYQKTLRSRR